MVQFAIDLSKFYNFSQDQVVTLSQVCDPDIFGDIDPENRTNCKNCVVAMHALMPYLHEVLKSCHLKEGEEECGLIFKTVVTENGVCFTFNGFDVYRHKHEYRVPSVDEYSDWTIDDGYPNSSRNPDDFPRRGSRAEAEFNLRMPTDAVDGGICKVPVQGFKIYIHLPNEGPQIPKHYYLLPYEHQTQLYIDPKVIWSAPEIREFPVSKRQCYFSNERYLRFFKFYTQNNCEEECVVNMTISRCGCQRFYIPRGFDVRAEEDKTLIFIVQFTGTPGDTMKLCGISDMKCYLQIVEESIKQNIDQSQNSECHCLPTCNSITYDMEVNRVALSEEADRFHIMNLIYLTSYQCLPMSKRPSNRQIYNLLTRKFQ
jgi:acid-sensing ion channel, other